MGNNQTTDIESVYPTAEAVPPELPEAARIFLEQAVASIHAPDGAAMLAGAAVDAMLLAKGLERGSVYERINEAVRTGVLIEAMADWAHAVRLGSNRPRHVDKDRPHVTTAEAQQAIEFVKALGHFLFVLPARINLGRETATKITEGLSS